MKVKIDETPNSTLITVTGVSAQAQRVEIVPGSIHEGTVTIGNTEVSGVILTVRPALQ